MRSIQGRAIPAALVVLAAACGLTPPPEPPRQQPTAPPTEVPANTNPDALPPPAYELAWQDEFDGSALGSAWTALSARASTRSPRPRPSPCTTGSSR
jgi:hypothetical protein